MSQAVRAAFAAALVALAAPSSRAQGNPAPSSAQAVDEKAFKLDAPGLYANADLSYVLTSGNSSSSTSVLSPRRPNSPPAPQRSLSHEAALARTAMALSSG